MNGKSPSVIYDPVEKKFRSRYGVHQWGDIDEAQVFASVSTARAFINRETRIWKQHAKEWAEHVNAPIASKLSAIWSRAEALEIEIRVK